MNANDSNAAVGVVRRRCAYARSAPSRRPSVRRLAPPRASEMSGPADTRGATMLAHVLNGSSHELRRAQVDPQQTLMSTNCQPLSCPFEAEPEDGADPRVERGLALCLLALRHDAPGWSAASARTSLCCKHSPPLRGWPVVRCARTATLPSSHWRPPT